MSALRSVSAWKGNSANFVITEFYEVRISRDLGAAGAGLVPVLYAVHP
jgi:hypothetical protein